MSKRATILLTGGGTGGHVFPLLAVATQLRTLQPNLHLVFVGTERGLESRVVPAAGYDLELMPSLPVRGRGIAGAIRGVGRMLACLPGATSLLRRYRPVAVLSVGGYAAVPVAVAARLLGVPLALMEPNCTLGLANRLIAPLVQRAYIAFEETAGYFRRGQVLQTGVALRQGFEASSYSAQSFNEGSEPCRILVLGGSQGALRLTASVAEALSVMPCPVQVTHQVGRGKLQEAKDEYARNRVRHPFELVDFIEDMPEALRRADLVVSRAGAGSIGEMTVVGRPSVLVPLPGSGQHQLHNARALEKAGAAVCLPSEQATGERLARLLSELVAEPVRLQAMARAAQSWSRPDAAVRVAADLLSLGKLGAAASGGQWAGDRAPEVS